MHPSLPADHAPAASRTGLDAELLRHWPLPLDEAGDKHSRGTVLVIAGSRPTAGAALLAGIAALRMGAGRLQIATAAPIAVPLSVAVPEAMVIPLPIDESNAVRARAASVMLTEPLADARAVLIGPGMFGVESVRALLEHVAVEAAPGAILVADAAALQALGQMSDRARRAISTRLVLTPNRQELRSLFDSIESARGASHPPADGCRGATVAQHFGATVTCFNDVDGYDGSCWSSRAATPGLGTSGSGDVLSGLVAGAAARSGDTTQAACWATYVHAEAGNRLSQKQGRTSFLARELLDEVPDVLHDLEH
jgi:hydroxyethylthiazole kinase-like uncharacterized protein yjeF